MLVIVGGAAFLIGLIVALGMNQLKVKKLTEHKTIEQHPSRLSVSDLGRNHRGLR